MENAGDITRRIKLPIGVTLQPNTRIELWYKRSERKFNAGSWVVEVYIRLVRNKQEQMLETDTVVPWQSLPRLAKNRAAWEKVRTLVADDGYAPDGAYVEVAFQSLLKKGWRFDAEVDRNDFEVRLSVRRSALELENLTATLLGSDSGTFFAFDEDQFDREREKEIAEEYDNA